VLPIDAAGLTAPRRALYDAPKIIASGLSRILRARCDQQGEFAGGVGTFLAVPRETGAKEQRLLRRGTLLLNSAYLSELHRSRRGPMSLSGGNLPLGRLDIDAFPFPSCLALPAAEIRQDAIEGYLRDRDARLPSDDVALLALLDAAFDRLQGDGDDPWDHLVQRVVLALMGCSAADAAAILEAWSSRQVQARITSRRCRCDSRGSARADGSPTRVG
jgi:hypothetical protein